MWRLENGGDIVENSIKCTGKDDERKYIATRNNENNDNKNKQYEKISK